LYYSLSIIRAIKSSKTRRAGHVTSIWERRGSYRVLVGKPEGKRLLGRHRRRLVNNIEMYLQKFGWGVGDMDWINLDQDRDRWQALVNAVMNLPVP
jgi:hypothetical protein